MRISLAQINPTVGALETNAAKIGAYSVKAREAGAQVVVFPELALSGYPPEDLLLKPHFVEVCEATLDRLAATLPPDLVVVVGSPVFGEEKAANGAAVFHDGRRVATYRKMLLPNYGVFDEKRVFEAGTQGVCLQIGPYRLGLHICEDSWYAEGPATRALVDSGLHALCNLSASPYHFKKQHQRIQTLRKTVERMQVPLLYCNLIGGQDELVFDGGSLVLHPEEGVLARALEFQEDLLMFDLPDREDVPALELPAAPGVDVLCISREELSTEPEARPSRIEPDLEETEEVYQALVLGLRDYVDKNGFKEVLVALSGGIDSALVASLAVDALGPERVVGLTMPSQYSSDETLSDAGALARNLGMRMHTLPIRDIFEHMLGDLQPLWPGKGADTTEENLQARIRGVLAMALSNKFGYLVLATGNKSELATGYCTLYGDMCGGFALIKDVPKTLVFRLCRDRNARQSTPWIPESTITRPPSAELRPDQKDSDSLPPYELLDQILEAYVEKDLSVARMVAQGLPEDTVTRIVRLVDLNEYKRRQAAPGIKITPKAFGRDRRMPITNQFRDRPPSEWSTT